ncbi:MAG: ABC transporter ATP-binding protein [Candidatus Levybacteria bacterium]|nr:ABC transporter ATP-binding protein [Candidatus Levybacteria bacterium]
MKSTPPVRLSQITKEYGLVHSAITQVLGGISLTVKKGDFIAITGPSGSGKSTLMNIIGLLDIPTSGVYFLHGNNITSLSDDQLSSLRNKEIGFVFQSFNLLGRISVLENVVLPAIYAGTGKDKREEKAKKLLSSVGLEKYLQNHPNQLSGGQQQRVAIARALINDPNIILADEPTGNLDTKSAEEIMAIFRRLNREGKTIILITHEKDIAAYAKKVVKMRDGKIV